MAVEVAARFGIIIRKTARSCALAEELTAEFRKLFPPRFIDGFLGEDEQLLSLTISPRRPDMHSALAKLSHLGFQEGVDYVITEPSGVQGELPGWLKESR